ncbi:hypothetical protein D9M68_407410 [compost metagenome]
MAPGSAEKRPGPRTRWRTAADPGAASALPARHDRPAARARVRARAAACRRRCAAGTGRHRRRCANRGRRHGRPVAPRWRRPRHCRGCGRRTGRPGSAPRRSCARCRRGGAHGPATGWTNRQAGRGRAACGARCHAPRPGNGGTAAGRPRRCSRRAWRRDWRPARHRPCGRLRLLRGRRVRPPRAWRGSRHARRGPAGPGCQAARRRQAGCRRGRRPRAAGARPWRTSRPGRCRRCRRCGRRGLGSAWRSRTAQAHRVAEQVRWSSTPWSVTLGSRIVSRLGGVKPSGLSSTDFTSQLPSCFFR